MNRIERILVVGGGVGGLTAATALAQRGKDVLLIERRPAFDVPGVGLGQPANALRVYDDLGLLEQVLDAGFSYDHMTVFDADRRLIYHHDFLLGDDRVPPVCALSRARLHDILYAAALEAGVQVRLGTTLSDVQDEPDGVTAVFSDGAAHRFDVVAGFDGIRSTVREHVYGTIFLPRPSGFGAWRVQVPRDSRVQGMEFLQGIGSKVGAMPLADNLMYLFHIRPESPQAWFDRDQFLDLFRERVAGYGSYVAEAVADLDADADIVYSPIEPMLLPWPWHRGRVVLGGDAAHTFPPHLTQGAAMAAEDALVLAEELTKDDGTVEERLHRYGQRRYPRVAFVYTFSYQWMLDEQAVTTPELLDATRAELAHNGSARVAVSDRILNRTVVGEREFQA